MNSFDLHGKTNLENEIWIKSKFDELVAKKTEDYALVSITLKNFDAYLLRVGPEHSEEIIELAFNQLAGCLGGDEYIVRLHSWHFNLIIKCAAQAESLHQWAHEFHYSIRDVMEVRYNEKLYLEMGFCPITQETIDYYTARYYADLCRLKTQKDFKETTYDMYFLFYNDSNESFRKLEPLVEPALQQGHFKLFLQPKMNLKTGKVDAAEALMRWIDPVKGMIPLSNFLENIEINGMIRDIDLYLFDQACQYMDKWKNIYHKSISISFNLSNAYFIGPYFMPEYTEVFEKYNLPAACVCIELLESTVLNKLESLVPLVKKIEDYGFECALDDFGSGFSNFDILTSINLDELKIDKSLFRDFSNEKEKILIKHIVEIAHDLNIRTVAEGVENENYVNFLKEIGCDFVQGFYYYKPMPIEEFEEKFVLNQ